MSVLVKMTDKLIIESFKLGERAFMKGIRYAYADSKFNEFLKKKLPEWKTQGRDGVEDMEVAVMGCIVNGPGESKNANIGISLPGTGENPSCPVYVDGKQKTVLKGDTLKDDFFKIIEGYVEGRY